MRFAPGIRFLPLFAALILASLSACLTNPSGPPTHVGKTGRFMAVAYDSKPMIIPDIDMHR